MTIDINERHSMTIDINVRHSMTIDIQTVSEILDVYAAFKRLINAFNMKYSF